MAVRDVEFQNNIKILVFLCLVIYYQSKLSLECLKGRNSKKIIFFLPHQKILVSVSTLLKGTKQRSELELGGK